MSTLNQFTVCQMAESTYQGSSFHSKIHQEFAEHSYCADDVSQQNKQKYVLVNWYVVISD